MADVYSYNVLTGTIVPDTATIQAEVQTEFVAAFGSALSLDPSTPQGMLINGETLARSAVADNNVAIANQINPNLAGGVYLDAIAALTGAQRAPTSFSQVIGTLTGVSGTIVPIGSQAQDTNGNIWATTTAVTIVGGTAAAIFQAVGAGAITIAVNTLTNVVSTVLGWETVTNPSIETQTGSAAQTDVQFRNYRLQTLAGQGDALPLAIIAGLFTSVPLGGAGCTSVSFLENISPSTQTIEGVTMVGHSIYVCASGGTNAAIAQVLVDKKSGGCAYNNGAGVAQSVTLTVPYSNQVMTILFDRPTPVPVQAQVTIQTNSSIQDPEAVVQAAILAYANGQLSGEPGLIIGGSVSAFEFAGAITTTNPGIVVLDLQIATIPGSLGYVTIPIAVYQQATIQASSITVIQA